MELWKHDPTGEVIDDADKDIKAWKAWLNAKCNDAFDEMDHLDQEIPLWCVMREMATEIEQLRANVGGGDTAIRYLEAEVEAHEQELRDVRNEVASVLLLMDGLAEQWGDEANFRRCRDRLRALATEAKPNEP